MQFFEVLFSKFCLSFSLFLSLWLVWRYFGYYKEILRGHFTLKQRSCCKLEFCMNYHKQKIGFFWGSCISLFHQPFSVSLSFFLLSLSVTSLPCPVQEHTDDTTVCQDARKELRHGTAEATEGGGCVDGAAPQNMKHQHVWPPFTACFRWAADDGTPFFDKRQQFQGQNSHKPFPGDNKLTVSLK